MDDDSSEAFSPLAEGVRRTVDEATQASYSGSYSDYVVAEWKTMGEDDYFVDPAPSKATEEEDRKRTDRPWRKQFTRGKGVAEGGVHSAVFSASKSDPIGYTVAVMFSLLSVGVVAVICALFPQLLNDAGVLFQPAKP